TELSNDAISQLESISKFRVYAKNHALFRAGELANRLYVLKSGWARLTPKTQLTNIANVPGAGNGGSPARNWEAKAVGTYVGPSHWFRVCAITRRGGGENTLHVQ